MRANREAVVHDAFADVFLQRITNAVEVGEAPVFLGIQTFLELPQAVGDIAHHFDLREIHRVHLGGIEVDVNHFGATGAHEEGRLLHHVVAHVDDQVGLVDGSVYKVAVGQCGVAQEVWAGFVDDAFAHLGGDHRNAQLFHELAQHLAGQLAVGASAGQQQRFAGALDGFDGLADGFVFGNRATG